MGRATTGWTMRSPSMWSIAGWRRGARTCGRRWCGARHGEGASSGEAVGGRGAVWGGVEGGLGGAAGGWEGERGVRALLCGAGGGPALARADCHGGDEPDEGGRGGGDIP